MAKYKNLKVGVLALQGDFEQHQRRLLELGADVTLVRLPAELERIDGLIIPGGESTTMDKLIDRFQLRQPLLKFASAKPIWGTCAGMIMLSRKIEDNRSGVTPLGLLDIDVVRMGYGRQVFSFEDNFPANLNGRPVELKAAFIRAPKITRVGPGVRTLAVYRGDPVLVTDGNHLACSFHTELGDDTALHRYFLEKFLSTKAVI